MSSGVPEAPNTVRLAVAVEKRDSVGLMAVQKGIVEDLLGMPRESIFCVQCFPTAGWYDVTFFNREDLQTCMARRAEKADDERLEGVTFLCSEMKQRVPIIVHMYNPFVRDEEVRAFLFRYCEVVSAGVHQTNVLGTFNGNRKFFVVLRPDVEGVGGVRHPPQTFSIGTNRGYLWYPGQPLFCRNCFSFGHTREDCEVGLTCRNCFKPGHRTSECDKRKRCHTCGSRTHLARQCPVVARLAAAERVVRVPRPPGSRDDGSPPSYADVASGVAARRSNEAEGSTNEGMPEVITNMAEGVLPEEEPGPAPSEAGDECGTGGPSGDLVPDTLKAEGEEEPEEELEEELEEEEEEVVEESVVEETGEAELAEVADGMDLDPGPSLKRKMEGEVAGPSQVIESFPSDPDSPRPENIADSDSSQSFVSSGQLATLQSVMGYAKPESGKKKKQKAEPCKSQPMEPRTTRARERAAKR